MTYIKYGNYEFADWEVMNMHSPPRIYTRQFSDGKGLVRIWCASMPLGDDMWHVTFDGSLHSLNRILKNEIFPDFVLNQVKGTQDFVDDFIRRMHRLKVFV
jgi:hypothetical protein